MTIEEQIAVMQAFKDGKTIEFADDGTNWEKVPNPVWNWDRFNYRVKPEPKIRPYKNTQFIKAMKVHGPYLGVDTNGEDFWVIPNQIKKCGVKWHNSGSLMIHMTYMELMKGYEWIDGTPCGIEEE